MALKLALRRSCWQCGKPLGNPLTHTCAGGGDFDRRRKAQKRAAATAARRKKAAAERERVRDRIAAVRKQERAKSDARVARARQRSRAPGPRPRAAQHDYRRCQDADCLRVPCEAYRDGYSDGQAAAQEDS